MQAVKAQPGKITYASAGTGSGTHMNAEKFKFSAGIDALHVPYKGTPEALTDSTSSSFTSYESSLASGASLTL